MGIGANTLWLHGRVLGVSCYFEFFFGFYFLLFYGAFYGCLFENVPLLHFPADNQRLLNLQFLYISYFEVSVSCCFLFVLVEWLVALTATCISEVQLLDVGILDSEHFFFFFFALLFAERLENQPDQRFCLVHLETPCHSYIIFSHIFQMRKRRKGKGLEVFLQLCLIEVEVLHLTLMQVLFPFLDTCSDFFLTREFNIQMSV